MPPPKIRRHGFLCYAHRGGVSPSRKFVDELQLHLNQIQPEHGHRAWCDQDIRAGEDWPTEVRNALDQAAYAVLFVNIEFLNSDFVQQVELPALLEAAQRDGLLLLALTVDACGLPDWIARIQFPGRDQKPLGKIPRSSRQDIYTSAAARINEFLIGAPSQSQSVRLMGEPSLPATRDPSPGLVSPSLDAASTVALDLADALSQHLADDLEGIRERYRRSGERAAAIAALDALVAHRSLAALNAGLRGRILRTAALYRLVGDDDRDAARDLAERAAHEDPDGDGQVLAAQMALHTEGAEAALAALQAPGSLEARHLKAALMIQCGEPEDSLALLEPQADDADATGEPTAETWRLRALALLTLGRLTDARDAIEQAEVLGPDWLAVRSVAAVIAFWCACTPAALTLTQQPLSPLPFSRAFLRADERARDWLAKAEQGFAAVAETLVAASDEWGHWLTWRMITLLALGNRRDEATALANRLLAGDGPVHIWPLLWADHFALDLDRAALKQRLSAATPDDDNFIVQLGLYFGLCLAEGASSAVLDELATREPDFATPQERDILRQWRVLALTAADRIPEASACADAIQDEGLRLRVRLHIGRAHEKTAPGSYAAAADALLAADPGPDALAEACDAHALSGDWAFVSAHADDLLTVLPTPASLRLLVNAAWNLGEYPRCLAALDQQRHVYPDGRLPDDLALLRVRCQRAIGDVSQAVWDARELFERDPQPQYLLELLDAQFQGGDQEGMRQSLRRMLGLDAVAGDTLLRAATLAGLMDRDLGALLWRRATETGSDVPDFAVRAAITGSSLGLRDEETAPWFKRMAELAASGAGGAMTLQISEMPGFIQAQRKAGEHVDGLYRRGEVPVHLLPEGMFPPFPPLAVLFHGFPETNQADPDPLRQPAVLVRHGARPLQRLKRASRPEGRLVMDITALLTAADLDLLDLIEAQFAPVYLTPQWHPLLLDEIRRLRPIQPERLAAERRVAGLVRAGAIGLVDLANLEPPPVDLAELVGDRHARELVYARNVGGSLVDFLPLHGPDLAHREPVRLPPDWQARLAGPRSLLGLALTEHLIDEAGHARASALFDQQPQAPAALPAHGGELLVSPGILILLAQVEVLPAFTARFRLMMVTDLWQHVAAELTQQEQNEPLAAWVQGLIDRLASGMMAGLYRIAETCRPPTPDADQVQSMRGLEDLLHYRGEPGDLIWFDDRLLSGYPTTETHRIVGVVEVLDLLLASGAINEAERFQRLARLRARNYRYIPLDQGEILHWLGKAHSDGKRLVVPPELEVLARYWSACLYQQDGLQFKQTERHPHGEFSFFFASRRAVDQALRAIWTDSRLNERRQRLRADWLLDWLYVGMDDIRHLIPGEDPNRDINLPGSEIGLLVMDAFAMMRGLPPKDKTPKTQGERYLEWICERVVSQRLKADPQVVVPAGASISQSLIGLVGDDSEPARAVVLGRWMFRYLRILPTALRTELHKDQALMQRLGLAGVTVIEIDSLRIAPQVLWPAVEGALRGAARIIHDVDGEKPLTLRLVSPSDAPQPVMELADAKGKSIGRHHFEHSEILSPVRDVRMEALRRHPQWWDGQPDGCAGVERLLAGIDSPQLRMQRLERLAARSADSHYMDLEAHWRDVKGMRIDRCFPPGLDSVLTYVRCSDAPESPTFEPDRCWEALARSIPAERGLKERLRRIALLPSALPDAARTEIRALDAEHAGRLLGQLSAVLTNPVGRLHLLDMALVAAEVLPEALEIAQAQINYLATPRFEVDTGLVLALVDVGYRAFDGTETDAKSPPQMRLLAAWVHATRVVGILLARGADPVHLAEQLQQWAPFPHRDLYAASGQPFRDLAWPWNVHTADLLFVGLGAILSRHRQSAGRLDLTTVGGRLGRFLSGQPDPATDVHLLRNPYLLSDRLGCLWGGDRAESLGSLIEPEAVRPFSPAAFDSQIDGLLDDLAQTPDQTDRWQMLWLNLGPGRLAPEPARRLDAILAGLDLDAFFHRDPLVLIPLMELAARHASDRGRIEACINRWAEGIDSGAYPTPEFAGQLGAEALEAFIERLIHWMHGLATRHPEDPDVEFSRLLDGLALRSRTIAVQLRRPLTNLVRRLPFVRHRALHRSLLCVRSRPAPAPDWTTTTVAD